MSDNVAVQEGMNEIKQMIAAMSVSTDGMLDRISGRMEEMETKTMEMFGNLTMMT